MVASMKQVTVRLKHVTDHVALCNLFDCAVTSVVILDIENIHIEK